MVTNLTNLTTVKNIGDLIVFNNSVTNDYFTILFIIAIFFVLLMTFLKNYSLEESFLGASFLCFAISIVMRALEWVPTRAVITFGIFMVISGMWVYLIKK